MLICANNFGSVFGWKEQVEITSSKLDFDRSPKGLVTAGILVTAKKEYHAVRFKFFVIEDSSDLGFSGDDLYASKNREKLDELRLKLYGSGGIKTYVTNPLFFSTLDVHKPSSLQAATLGSILIFAVLIAFFFFQSKILFMLYLFSIPSLGLLLALI